MPFLNILIKHARNNNFKVITALTGADGMNFVLEFLPDAILLDLGLPDIDGQSVIESLKNNPRTRHIPVYIISAHDEKKILMQKGLIGYLQKPVDSPQLLGALEEIEHYINTPVKKILLVENNKSMQKNITKLLGNKDIRITDVHSADEAEAVLEKEKFHCMILDLALPGSSGFEFLDKLSLENKISFPVIIYSAKKLTQKQEVKLREFRDNMIIKGVVSPERLLDETTLFLHRVEQNLPAEKRQMIRNIHEKDDIFRNKNILIVDDDMRNLFALTKILEEKQMNVLRAENGKKALEILEEKDNIHLVLMDIMMPGMSGYEAIRDIRKMENKKTVPVIALTAKAMREDKEMCIKAGADDFMTKPLDEEKLFSMMRTWLYR